MRNVITAAGLQRVVGRSTVAAYVVIALLVSAGCGPSAATAPASASAVATSQPTATGPTQANPVTLTMTVPSNVLYSAFYVGVEKGIFLKHGIDLKVNLVASGSEALKTLQSGQAQFTANSWTTMVPLVAQGVPMKAFGLISGRPDAANYDAHLAIVVRPGVTATSVAQLKGLKVLSQFGGGSDTWLRAQLTKAGLNPATDLQLINSPSANNLSTLQTQGADAAGASEPYPSIVLASLAGSRLLVRGGGVSEARVFTAALDPWLTGNPVLVDRVIAAQMEALQYVRQHPDEAAASASHYLSNLDPKIVTASLKFLDFDPRWSSKIQESFESASQGLLTSGVVKTLPKTTDMLVLDQLTTYEKKYPQYFNDLK